MKEFTYGIFDPDLFETKYCSRKLKILMASACMVAIKSPRRLNFFKAALAEGASQEELIESTSIGFLMGSSQLLQSYKSILYSSIKEYLKEEINPEAIDEFFIHKNRAVQSGFTEFYKSIYREGMISSKEKELVALSVSVALNCTTCEDSHIIKALGKNAVNKEIEEAREIGQYVLASEALSKAELI